MTHKQYFVLTKNNCKFNEETGHWTIDLPREFVHSAKPKSITVLNFMYYGTWVPKTGGFMNMEHTSFHCPTLIDGNFHQENYYINTIAYNYNTVYKTYPIKSHCEKLEFWFKDADGEIIKLFYIPKVQSGYDDRAYEERFVIDLLLEF